MYIHVYVYTYICHESEAIDLKESKGYLEGVRGNDNFNFKKIKNTLCTYEYIMKHIHN